LITSFVFPAVANSISCTCKCRCNRKHAKAFQNLLRMLVMLTGKATISCVKSRLLVLVAYAK
jgi:hypothetical protein